VLTMNSVKILHPVRSAITATAELLVTALREVGLQVMTSGLYPGLTPDLSSTPHQVLEKHTLYFIILLFFVTFLT